MSNPTSTATLESLAKSIDPGVQKNFVDAYKLHEPKGQQILQVGEQVDYNEEGQGYTGLGDLPRVNPGQNYTSGSNIQTYNTVLTPIKYGQLYGIEEELIRYGKEKKIYNAAMMQGRQAARHQETKAAGIFNHGFNPSYTSYGDGSALFDDHTSADGGANQSNKSTAGIVFNEANLETGMLAMESVLDDRGMAIEFFADTLLIPPALRKQAIIVVKSELRSGTTDNDLNAYKQGAVEGLLIQKVIPWEYLRSDLGGSQTAWFLLDSAQHQITWLWGMRTKNEKSTEYGFNNDTITYKVKYEASTGWWDWRGAWGSPGA